MDRVKQLQILNWVESILLLILSLAYVGII